VGIATTSTALYGSCIAISRQPAWDRKDEADLGSVI